MLSRVEAAEIATGKAIVAGEVMVNGEAEVLCSENA